MAKPGELVGSQRSTESSFGSVLEGEKDKLHESTPLSTAPLEDSRDLASFLIERASRSDILANYLYWYLKVESDGSSGGTRIAQNANRKRNA